MIRNPARSFAWMVARILAIRSTAGRIERWELIRISLGGTEVVRRLGAGVIVGHVASGLPGRVRREDSALRLIRASIAPLDRDHVDRLGDSFQVRRARR